MRGRGTGRRPRGHQPCRLFTPSILYRIGGMLWMAKMLLKNTGHGNSDGEIGMAMGPKAPLFVQ